MAQETGHSPIDISMPEFLRLGLGLEAQKECVSYLKDMNILTPNDLILAVEEGKGDSIRDQLIGNGVPPGDGAKVASATLDTFANTWFQKATTRTPEEDQDVALSMRRRKKELPIRNNHGRKQENVFVNGVKSLFAPVANFFSLDDPDSNDGTPPGAPHWWKEHDRHMKMIAAEAKDNLKGAMARMYPWQGWREHPRGVAILWERRAEILSSGFWGQKELRAKWLATQPKLSREWYALIQEIDRSVVKSSSDGKGDPCPKYEWEEVPDDQKLRAMTARRLTLLKSDLTSNVELQSEWVVLMRCLEAAEQGRSATLSPLKMYNTNQPVTSLDLKPKSHITKLDEQLPATAISSDDDTSIYSDIRRASDHSLQPQGFDHSKAGAFEDGQLDEIGSIASLLSESATTYGSLMSLYSDATCDYLTANEDFTGTEELTANEEY